ILVGQETFGKGSIQAIYPLKDGSTLRITTAVWLTPDRQRLDGVGLTPHRVIEALPGQDAALDAALNVLREMIE
ncbi:MAG: S41 family peptidase, partial [Anaerolineae bacterium]|nr:S41 family peptidase [Anaerolineae bacterium]